jgi:hypothetical protein
MLSSTLCWQQWVGRIGCKCSHLSAMNFASLTAGVVAAIEGASSSAAQVQVDCADQCNVCDHASMLSALHNKLCCLHFLVIVSKLQRARAAAVDAAGYLNFWGSIRVTSGWSTRLGNRSRFSGRQPVSNPLLLLLLRCLQVIVRGIEVRACAAFYLRLPRRGRVDAPKLLAMDSCDIHVSSGALQWVGTALRAGVG